VENTLRRARAAQAARFHPAPLVARHAHHLIALPAAIKYETWQMPLSRFLLTTPF